MINPFVPDVLPNGRWPQTADVTLSICVPAHNRADVLEYLLPKVKAWSAGWGFNYEVVISDDDSTDNTIEVVESFKAAGIPIQLFKQTTEKGSANQLSAAHRATGKYVLTVPKDMVLIPETVADMVRFMHAHPDVRACYAPAETYSDIGTLSTELSYEQPDEARTFQPGDEVDLIGYLVQNHIVPEVALFRADAARQIVSAPELCHWAFAHLATVSAKGGVAFRRAPCVRALPPMPGQAGSGGQDTSPASWDPYRGGLEYMVFNLMRRRQMTVTEDLARSFRGLIDHFMAHRMRKSLDVAMKHRDFIRVYEIVCRLSHLDPALVRTFPHMDRLPLMVMAQTLARFANAIAEVERLMVAGVEDGQVLGQLLRDAGLDRRILVIPPPATPSPKNLRSSVVFIAREDMRQSFLDQGYAPALIVSEQEIGSSLLI